MIIRRQNKWILGVTFDLGISNLGIGPVLATPNLEFVYETEITPAALEKPVVILPRPYVVLGGQTVFL